MSLKACLLQLKCLFQNLRKKKSLYNVMSELYKNSDAKKSKVQKIGWIIWDER